ncbi:MAG: DegT/DnrJ/EryC1/StrS family aminotransferase [Oscillospiraceae bacterium]|nr:DegT/DnrJ/EryC1/StrS family aminotransferase [Oscillospiraceae bacterium]
MNTGKHNIPLVTPHMSDEGYEQKFIKEAFDANWIAPLGANVTGFEDEICTYIGAKAAAALVSGTSAMHLAIRSEGIGNGDIVLCQSLTFSASVNPVIYENATPVFIDSESDTWNMSPEALERAFVKYPKAKAVILVHLYGTPAKLDEITAICKKRGAVLLEDAAEALGSTYGNEKCGTFGDFGILSFNGNKIITTSGGGMLLCNLPDADERIAKVRFWAAQSRDPARYYQHSELGYNYRMSNILAGIGRGQMLVLNDRLAKKRHIFDYYSQKLSGLDGLEMMPRISGQNCWLSCIQLNGKISSTNVMDALLAEGIESRPVWKPMHLQPLYINCDYIDNGGVSERLFTGGVCLPSDTKLADEELDRVCSVIRGLWE